MLKILKPQLSDRPKAVALFQQEAAVLGKLQHPGIPRVAADGYFQVRPRGGDRPLRCLTMEKIEGQDLQQWMRSRGGEPADEALAIDWLGQAIDILAHVHAQNSFHRDIKPSNSDGTSSRRIPSHF